MHDYSRSIFLSFHPLFLEDCGESNCRVTGRDPPRVAYVRDDKFGGCSLSEKTKYFFIFEISNLISNLGITEIELFNNNQFLVT